MKHFIVATAGHVDHGKSSLVKALTGTDPDRLPEEKARGITIDLGFAHLDLERAGTPIRVGIVDVPGHEDFVKNMVAGVGSVNLALFVVAADDGWMPQTEEHLQILQYLGVSQAIIALTKFDIAALEESELVAEIREKLARSSFAEAPIVSTSVLTGRGIPELRNTLAEVLARTPEPPDLGKPRLPVDRVFTLRGIGTVITGTLTGGALRKGQTVVVQPSGKPTRIRSIQSHNAELQSAAPGSRTALNLPDLSVAGAGQEGIQRGEIITLPELGGAVETLDVWIEKSARLGGSEKGAARAIKSGSLVRWHQGSANFPVRIHIRGGLRLSAGQQLFAQLRFDSPAFVLSGERFIIRDWSEQFTLAGGIVLDTEASRDSLRDPAQEKFLEARLKYLSDPAGSVQALLARDKVVPRASLLTKSLFSTQQIADAAQQRVDAKKIVIAAEFAADAGWWGDLQKRAATHIDSEHRAHPERTGLPLTDLRASLAETHSYPGLFDALVASLKEFEKVGANIRRGAHRQELPPQLVSAGNRITAALAGKPLDPPNRKELAPDALSQQALRFLIETKQAVEIGPDAVLSGEAYQKAVASVRAFLSQRPGTVSDLRQAIGASRRIVVPLLERLDKEGVTRREGDLRKLRS